MNMNRHIEPAVTPTHEGAGAIIITTKPPSAKLAAMIGAGSTLRAMLQHSSNPLIDCEGNR